MFTVFILRGCRTRWDGNRWCYNWSQQAQRDRESLSDKLQVKIPCWSGKVMWLPAVALTQMSAYGTHKNLAVRKIMEMMCTAYAKRDSVLSTSQTTHEANNYGRHISWKESAHCLGTTFQYFAELCDCGKGALETRHSFRWYAFRNFSTQISRPLAYGVRISSKASVTAGLLPFTDYNHLICPFVFTFQTAALIRRYSCAKLLDLKFEFLLLLLQSSSSSSCSSINFFFFLFFY